MVLEVRSNALAETRLTAESLEPADGQALLRILRFGCTANNVTYALLGDMLGFARFFPAPAGWTRVPAWGIAEVVATRAPAVREGECFFGYCPMATEMLLTPRAAPFGVVDVAEHRASLMPAYNAYRQPDVEREDEQILLRPLFLLAFIDVAGDERVRRSVHEHFGEDLIYSGFVGATHLDAGAFAAPPALDHGPQPEPVSANALLRARVRATGQDTLDADIARAWARYVAWCDGWLTVRRGGGPDAVRAAFLDVLGGRVAPNEAHVVSMHSSL